MDSTKKIVRRFFEKAGNKKNLDMIETLVAETAINHDSIEGEKPGRVGLKNLLYDFFLLFPVFPLLSKL